MNDNRRLMKVPFAIRELAYRGMYLLNEMPPRRCIRQRCSHTPPLPQIVGPTCPLSFQLPCKKRRLPLFSHITGRVRSRTRLSTTTHLLLHASKRAMIWNILHFNINQSLCNPCHQTLPKSISTKARLATSRSASCLYLQFPSTFPTLPRNIVKCAAARWKPFRHSSMRPLTHPHGLSLLLAILRLMPGRQWDTSRYAGGTISLQQSYKTLKTLSKFYCNEAIRHNCYESEPDTTGNKTSADTFA